MPSMSAGLSPASAIALRAASACNWICAMSGMTPSRVVSAAPTMAIDFGFIAVGPRLEGSTQAVLVQLSIVLTSRASPAPATHLGGLVEGNLNN
jgi:hypothetical protein